MLDANFARVHEALDLLDVVHHKVAVDLLDQDGLHHYGLEFVEEHLADSVDVGFASEDAQMSEVVHWEDLVHKQFPVIEEVDIVTQVHPEVLQSPFLVAHKFANEVLWHLNSLDLELVEGILNSML